MGKARRWRSQQSGRVWIGLVLTVALLGASSKVSFADDDPNEASWRLWLALSTLQVAGGTRDFEQRSETLSGVAAGVAAQSALFGVGARLSQNISLGMTLALGYSRSERESMSTTTVVYELLPQLQVLFLEGGLRPSLSAVLGFSGSEVIFGSGFGDSSISSQALSLGAAVGLHYFPFERLSLDLSLLGLYALGVGESDTGQNVSDFDLRMWQLSLWMGLSCYL